jgi:hypothetical protein
MLKPYLWFEYSFQPESGRAKFFPVPLVGDSPASRPVWSDSWAVLVAPPSLLQGWMAMIIAISANTVAGNRLAMESISFDCSGAWRHRQPPLFTLIAANSLG